VQNEFLPNLFDHAHDDYLEIAATTGALGFTIAVGHAARRLLVARPHHVRRRSRRQLPPLRVQGAALMSITVAMVHALFDFNFYIPANPATLAAIAGAAAAAYSRSFDADATADRIARHRVRKPHVDPVDAA